MPFANPNKIRKRKDELEQRMSQKRLVYENDVNTSPAAIKKENLKNSRNGSSRHTMYNDVNQEQSYVFDQFEDARSREHDVEDNPWSRDGDSGDIESGGSSGDIQPLTFKKPQKKSAKERRREMEARYASSGSGSDEGSDGGMEMSYDLDELGQSSDGELSGEIRDQSSTSKTFKMDDSGNSIPNNSQASTLSNEDSAKDQRKKKLDKIPLNSRKSHALHMSVNMTGDVHGSPTKRAPPRSKSSDAASDMLGNFDEEASGSTDVRSAASGSRGTSSKGSKSTRKRTPMPPRSKSSTDAPDDISNSRKPPPPPPRSKSSTDAPDDISDRRKPPQDFQKSRSGELHQGDLERRAPSPRTTSAPSPRTPSASSSSGRKPKVGDLQGMFDQELPLQSTDSRSTASGSRGGLSKGGKSTRHNMPPSRSKSTDEAPGDFLKSGKPPQDPREAQEMNKSDLQQEELERRAPSPRTPSASSSSGRKPKVGDLQGMFDQELPLQSTDSRSTASGSRGGLSKGGKSTQHNMSPSRSKSTNEAPGDFLKSGKPPQDPRNAQDMNKSDLEQEELERRAPSPRTASASSGRKLEGGDLQGRFDQEVPLKSADARSIASGSRGALSKREKSIRHNAPPSRSKSTTEPPSDFLKRGVIPPQDPRDLQQEDLERCGPSRSATDLVGATGGNGRNSKGGDLQGRFDKEVPSKSADARSIASGSIGALSKGGKSILRNGPPSRSKSTTEAPGEGGKPRPILRNVPPSRSKSTTDSPRNLFGNFLSGGKPRQDPRKEQELNKSRDLQQEDLQRRAAPHSASDVIASGGNGRKPKSGELQGMFDKEPPLHSTDSRSVGANAASRDTISKGGKSAGRIAVQMRDTDRLLRGRGPGPGMERQDSSRPGGSGLQRQGSVRPGMARQESSPSGQVGGRSVSREPSKRDNMSREPSRNRSLSRDPSSRGGGLSRGMSQNRSLSREPSSRAGLSRGMSRNRSMSREPSSREGLSRGMSGSRSMSREPSSREGLSRGMSGSRSMSREPSSRGGGLSRGMSRNRSMSRGPSSREGMARGMSRSRSMSRDPSKRDRRSRGIPRGRSGSRGDPNKPESARSRESARSNRSQRPGFDRADGRVRVDKRGGGGRRDMRYNDMARRYLRQNLESPPKTLVIIWLVVAAELCMDLVTTIISFLALVKEASCCDQTIDLGPLPLSVTIPFFILIITELCFLARAIRLTLWPPKFEFRSKEDDVDKHWLIRRCMCCFYRWNVKMLFKYINWFVLLNPFFGAVVAWMLLYQSSKNECFAVLGLEAASLLLHFLSVYLEGERQTLCSILFHCIPVLPFFVSIVVILVYLQQGGVCYLVEDALFWYEGCQLCPDDAPPIDGFCRGENETLIEVLPAELLQADFCSPERNFCFFVYE
jgi:hypothetical protein